MEVSESEFRARDYEILFEKYQKMHYEMTNRARQLGGSTQVESDEMRDLLRAISDKNKYSHFGFASDEDLAVIRTLEYVLGERDKQD